MKLRRLSLAFIAFCGLGLSVLLGTGYLVSQDIRAQRAEADSLLSLQERLSMLAMASEGLLLFPPDPGLWQSLEAEARAVRQSLLELERRHPGAARLAQYVDLMLQVVETEYQNALDGDAVIGARGPLALSQRSRNILTQLAGHDVALHSAVATLLRQRQQAMAARSDLALAALVATAVFFGLLCMLAFFLMHYRVTRPVTGMARVIERLSAGDRSARVHARGRDELAELGRAFDRLLDHQDASRAALERYERTLEERAQALAESQRIARVGSLRVNLASGRVEWSEETCRIFGIAAEDFAGTLEGVLERIHPDDRQLLLAEREQALRGETPLDIEFRVMRPDGQTRIVHQWAELKRSEQGRDTYLVGTIQDVTEQREARDRIRQQQYLLDTAARVARVGGWSVDVAANTIYWSDAVCDIHEMPRGTTVPVEEGIAFYTPESRGTIEDRYGRCVTEGRPFDEELDILTARGRRVWVRVTGEAVHDQSGDLMRVQGAFQDITPRKESEARVQRMARELRTTLDNVGEAFFTLDRDWRFTYLNAEAVRLLKQDRDALIGEQLWDKYPGLDDQPIGDAYRDAMSDGKTAVIEEFYYPPLQGWFDVRIYPSERGLAVFFMNVSERHRMLQTLRDQEADIRRSRDRLAGVLRTRQILINSLPAHIALLAPDGEILDVNEHWREFTRENGGGDHHAKGENYLAQCLAARGEGAEQAWQIAEGLEGVLRGESAGFSMEYPCHLTSGQRWFRASVNRLSQTRGSDTEPGAVVMHMDVTERKQAEERLNRLAFEDPLTCVLSRNGFTRELDLRMAQTGWDERGMVVMLDLMNLRHVNDAHGYAVGDQLLRQVGERLQSAAGEEAFVGRAGGDEFMVYLPGREGQTMAQCRHRLSGAFRRPFEVDGFAIEVVARYGYTQLRKQSRAIEQLLREAELALFQGSDRDGPQRWSAYTARLDADTRSRVEITHQLHRALERDEFELYFQPKVDLNTGRVVAAEALIRWHHPERGMVSPALFIPVAEQSQLIGPIGDWVVTAACRALAGWQAAGLDIVRVAVNVSLKQFSFGDFPRTVKAALRQSGVAPGALSLEITESVFEREEDGLRQHLSRLHEAGIRLSLDDFGTGYSSLLYLQKYPFDEIKIDQGFVSGMVNDHYSREIVRTVIGVAGMIGAEVVAEGVETAAERDALLEMGCHVGQGYYFSRPLSAKDFRTLLEKRAALPS